MIMNDASWHLVRNVPRVMVSSAAHLIVLRLLPIKKPMPVNRLQESVDKPKHKTLFEPGEVIRVS